MVLLQRLARVFLVFPVAARWCDGGACADREDVPLAGEALLQAQHFRTPYAAFMHEEEEEEEEDSTEDEDVPASLRSRLTTRASIVAIQDVVSDQPLTEGGFRTISEECCLLSFDTYTRRIIADMNLEICNEGCYNGFFPWFHCETEFSLEKYRAKILENTAEVCWCFRPIGECDNGPGPDCSAHANLLPNPTAHRRRRCGSAKTTTTTTGRFPVTTTTIPVASRVCSLPKAVLDYSLITLGDAVINAHEIYRGVAVGGEVIDGTPLAVTNVHGPSIAKVKGAGNWNFKAGFTTGDMSSIFDWAHFKWLAQNTAYLKEGDYTVRVFKRGGTYSSAGVGWGLTWEGQGEDNGKTLMVFKTSEDIRLVGTSNGRQFGPSVLAPFSAVTLDGSAGFADGFIIAKEFGPSKRYPTIKNTDALQLHGDGYTGPLECKDTDADKHTRYWRGDRS